MKILIIGRTFPYRGAMASFNENLASNLQKQGNEVSILTYTNIYPYGDHKSLFCECKTNKLGLDIQRGVNNANPFSWKHTAKKICNQDFELIIYCYGVLPSAPSFACISKYIRKQKPNIKQLVLLHNVKPNNYQILGNYYVPKMISQMNGCIIIDKKTELDITRFNKTNKPAVYFPHPVYTHFDCCQTNECCLDKLGLDKNYKYVLYFGTINKYKGIDLLIDAFASKQLQQMPVKLIIAGDFHHTRDLFEEHIEQNDIADKVIIIDDYVPDNEVPYYFGAASIIAKPYIYATKSALLPAAQHFNKPMLITHSANSANTIEHNKHGYVVNPNAVEIAESLIDFFTNDKECEMSKQVELSKAAYTWDKMIDRIMGLMLNA